MAATFSTARAQSFNCDAGAAAGVPSNSYLGAAGQSGFWQNVDVFSQFPQPSLTDVNGNPTNVTLIAPGGGGPIYYDNAATLGDDAALLDDLQNAPGNWTFQNLAAGDYVVYSYAWAPDNPLGYITRVVVLVSPEPPQLVGGSNWSGVHIQGVTYARHRVCGVPQGGEIKIGFGFGVGARSCNGVQLVYTPPAGVACTPVGPTAGGCTPAIAATANPKLDHSNACSILIGNVDGQRAGLVFYGISGGQQVPWCAGGNSFLCVKSPTQRTSLMSSGGTQGLCDGSFALDWNAYQLAHPGVLGSPWSVCDRAWAQAWFRDPGSCKSTFLSPMVELVYTP